VETSAWALAVAGLLLAGAAQAADKPLQVKKCRQVVVEVEDPAARDTGERVAEFVCQKAMRLAPMFGLVKGQLVWVRIAADARSFHTHTGQSFYTLAVYMARGMRDMIITQPASILRTDERVEAVVTHELIHLMIRRAVGSRCPKWINEGLAQWYEGRKPTGPLPADEAALESLETRWHDPSVPVGQRRDDYRASLALVALLMKRIGEEDLLVAVRQLRKTRKPLDLDIDGRSLRMWLFRDRPAPSADADAPIQVEVQPGLDAGNQRPGSGGTGMSQLPLEEMLKRANNKKKKEKK
jgi:hypothetical protein